MTKPSLHTIKAGEKKHLHLINTYKMTKKNQSALQF